MQPLQLLISGKWQPSDSSEYIERFNPSTGELYARVPVGSESDVEAAVQAAQAAFPSWAELSASDRAALIHQGLDRVAAHADELAELEAIEMGKPVALGVPFIEVGIATMRDAAEESLTYPFTAALKADATGATSVVRKPLGVTAVIVPWNFPLAQALVSMSAVLAAGNTVVLKPSEKSSLSSIRFLELLDLPAGVVNLVLGDRRAGGPLAEHPLVNLVHFTGSIASGKSVGTAAGKGLRRAILELGGKDPVLIDADVDVRAVAADVARGAFTNSGQICTSMERIYVHKDIAEAFIEELVTQSSQFSLGDPLDPSTVLGPLIDEEQRSIVARHVADALAKGATAVLGGTQIDGPGSYYPPTVLVDVDESMTILQDETFGPVAPIRIVETFAEAVELASNSHYGLGMTVYSNTAAHIDMAQSVPAGIMWVNLWQGGDFSRQMEPAGQSGMGATGQGLSLDAATRPMAVHTAGALG
jgi:acyl-CoA reductase-like NAD-dependent aldehyde dehydrogenase